MSRANDPAFPQNEQRNANGDVYHYAYPGLTIREFAALHIFAAALPHSVSCVSIDTHVSLAFAYADRFCAALDAPPAVQS